MDATLKSKLDNAPKTPGCYLFYDSMGRIIYVGKSKLLHSRVRSYFGEAAKHDERIADLSRTIVDVSFVVTDTELEALITEYLLIKQHRPWFNAQHIRDLRPRYVGVALRDTHAAVTIEENTGEDGLLYIGPYKDSYKAEEAMALLGQVWHTPHCGKRAWDGAGRPCLYYDMQKCTAPCCRAQDRDAWQARRAELSAFLEGQPQPVMDRLTGEMRDAAAAFRFEEAQAVKESMEKLALMAKKVAHGFAIGPQTHALVWMRGFGETACSVFYVRDGRVRSETKLGGDADADAASAALAQDIARAADAPLDRPGIEACLAEIGAFRRFVHLAPDAGGTETLDALRALMAAR